MAKSSGFFIKPADLRAKIEAMVRILVQVTIYRKLRIGRDGHLDQSEAYDISQLVRE